MGRPLDRIYLDHNATTPLSPEALSAMTEVLARVHGNPSSTHAEGADARRRIEEARRRVAFALGAGDAEIVFTAGATEANNSVLHALASTADAPAHLVVTSIEHPSILEPATALEALGWRCTRLDVDGDGRIDIEELRRVVSAQTRLVSVILANNETGVIQDLVAVRAALVGSGAWLHVDATQAVGKWPVDFRALGADTLSLSAHKFGGPKGTGCLVMRRDTPFEALLKGGGQEKRLRGGTENVAGIVGLGVACEVAHRDLQGRMKRYAALRDRLWERIVSGMPDARRNAPVAHCLPNTLNVELPGQEGDVLMQALDLEGVAVSVGAACHSGSVSPSHVLVAMGRSPAEARASLRLSVGEGVDAAQVDRAADLLLELVERAAQGQGGAPRRASGGEPGDAQHVD